MKFEYENELTSQPPPRKDKKVVCMILINLPECFSVLPDMTFVAIPFPAHFDIERCEGCSFWWSCQMMNNNRKNTKREVMENEIYRN